MNSVSLGLFRVVVLRLLLKEIFTRFHSNQRGLRGEDVTLNVAGVFQEDAANKVTQ